MREDPDIVKILREEERLGKLTAQSQGSYEELETPGEVLEDMSDESITIMEDAEKDDFYEEPIQNGDLPSNESVDEKELIFQSSNDLMMYIDKFGKLLKINKAGLAFSGFSEEEVVGKMFWKLPGVFSKGNVPKYLKVFKNALKGKPTRNFVGKLDDKLGKTHIMDFSAFPVKENKKLKYVFVVAKELTEQKETESRYRLITENTDDLIAVAKLSLNPKYTYISPSHEKIMGYKPEELLGKPCLFFVHPDDKKKLISLLRKYVSAKGKKLFTGKDSDVNATIEYRAKDKSGNWHYLESTANIMGNELLLVSKDITERNKTEETVRVREEKHKALYNNAPLSYQSLNEDGNFNDVNPAWLKTLGYGEKEVIGKWFGDFLHPDWKVHFEKNFLEFKRRGYVHDVQFKIRHKDGHYLDISFEGYIGYNPDGSFKQTYCVFQDITERKQAEEALQGSEDKYRKLFELGSDALFLIEVETGRILDLNDTALKMYGYSREEALQMKNTDFSAEPAQTRQATVEHEQQIPVRYHKKKDGTIFPTDISVAYFTWYGREVCIAAIRDITERENAESEIKYLKEYNENILESNPNPIIVIKGDQIEYVNNSFVSTFGKNKDDYISKELKEVMPVEIIPAFEELLQDYNKKKELEIKGKSFGVSSFIVKKAEEEEERIGIILQDITERKKAEEEISKLSKFPSENKNPVLRVAADNTIIYANPASKSLLNIWNSEVGNPLPETLQSVTNDAINSKSTKEIEVPCGDITYLLSITPVKDEDYVNIYGLDITNRKKADEKIRESEGKFRILSEQSMLGVIIIQDGLVEYVNQAACEITEYSREEALNWVPGGFSKLFHPDDLEFVMKKAQKKQKGEKDVVTHYSYRIVTKSGKVIWVEQYSKTISFEGRNADFITILDITERKKAEERTKQQNKINIMRAEIWELAAQPLSENELIQQLVDKVGPFFNLEHVSFLRIYPEQKKAVVDIQWRKKDSESGIGEEFPLWLLKRYFGKPYKVISLRNIPSAAKPIVAPIFKKFDVKSTLLIPYGDIDNPQGYIATADRKVDKEWSKDEIDIFSEMMGIILLKSEEVKAEEKAKNHQIKIEQQNIKLKRLDRIKTDFFNVTSHELRTPMAAIKGYVQMLLKQTLGDVTPEQKDALNVVLRNTDRLDHLVQDILDSSRLESGTMKFIPEKTDITKVIKEVVETMQLSADVKNIKINTELEEIPELVIDQQRIKQVLMNLVDNAIKFSPYDSAVNLRIKMKKDGVLFEVQDFGRGIPKNKQKKIFERFYQVDSGMDRKFGGVGLGLSISKGVIQAHSGDIWVESILDKGSTFWFTLPLESVGNIEKKFRDLDIFGLEKNEEHGEIV